MNHGMKCSLLTLRMHFCNLRKIHIPVNCVRTHINQRTFTLKYLENQLGPLVFPRYTTATRFFSWQDLLTSERSRWEKAVARYGKEAAHFHQRLEKIHEQYLESLETTVLRIGDFAYFEEDGSIFRARESDEYIEMVLRMQDLGFPLGQIQQIRISPGQERLAASMSISGSEEAKCFIVNLQKLQQVEHVISNVFSFEWATDSILFYTEQKNVRCSSVFLCDFSEGISTKLVYTEKDPRFFVDICCTKDKKFLTINSNSKTTSEVWLVDCNRPLDLPCLVQQRISGVIYHIEHRDNTLYVLTTLGEHGNYKLMKTPVNACSMDNWELIYKVNEKSKLVDMELVKDYCVMLLKHNNYLHLSVISLVSESVILSTQDGTLVPITVFQKPSQQSKKKPLLVHVYGAYGIDLSMMFKPERLLLLEDGWMLAFCHVRGGGELGHTWHEEGRLENKFNGVEDLNACISQLHTLGYSSPSLTALTAASAGGVLAGALCNNYADLVRAIVLEAPFLDVLNTMLDELLPLTIEEQEEWGNPLSNERSLEYIKSYCPYQNIKSQNYPSVLITANENDKRIPLIGLLKYVDKLRKAIAEYSDSSNKKGYRTSNVILHIQPGGSHCNTSSWEGSLNEVAEQYAFLYKELGLDVK